MNWIVNFGNKHNKSLSQPGFYNPCSESIKHHSIDLLTKEILIILKEDRLKTIMLWVFKGAHGEYCLSHFINGHKFHDR